MMGSTMAPAVARGTTFGRRLARLLERRDLQRGAWLERAKAWEAGRPSAAGVVQLPRDARQVVALGVPCVDCLVLVYEQGQVGGNLVAEVQAELAAVALMRGSFEDGPPPEPAGHTVRFGMVPGTHWAEHVVARCPR
jgi:hypothetical protein